MTPNSYDDVDAHANFLFVARSREGESLCGAFCVPDSQTRYCSIAQRAVEQTKYDQLRGISF